MFSPIFPAHKKRHARSTPNRCGTMLGIGRLQPTKASRGFCKGWPTWEQYAAVMCAFAARQLLKRQPREAITRYRLHIGAAQHRSLRRCAYHVVVGVALAVQVGTATGTTAGGTVCQKGLGEAYARTRLANRSWEHNMWRIQLATMTCIVRAKTRFL